MSLSQNPLVGKLRNMLGLREKQSFDIVFDLHGPHGIHAERVMAYLRDFCCANRTTGNGDVQQMAIMEGRRQVFLKIMEIRKFDPHLIDEAKGNADELIGNYGLDW